VWPGYGVTLNLKTGARHMQKSVADQIVFDAVLAIKFGELLCEALYGDLAQQKPLLAVDKGTSWRVEGSRNRDGAIEGVSEFFLSVDKSDGRVTDVGELMRYHPHPSVIPLIIEHRRKLAERPAAMGEVSSSASSVGDEGPTTKSAAAMLLLTKLGRGGVVSSSDLAIKLGEVLYAAKYGEGVRQMPLAAKDMGTYWQVDGSSNRGPTNETGGQFFVAIQKYDGRIVEMGESGLEPSRP
jgi:NTF2 fold immunity protein